MWGRHLGRCSNGGGSQTNGGRQIGCKPLDKLRQLQSTCLQVKKILSMKLSSLIAESMDPEGLIFCLLSLMRHLRPKPKISYPSSCGSQFPLHRGLLAGGRVLSHLFPDTRGALLGSRGDFPSLVQRNHFKTPTQPVIWRMAWIIRVKIFHGSHVVTKTLDKVLGVEVAHDGPLVLLQRTPSSKTTLRHVCMLQKTDTSSQWV